MQSLYEENACLVAAGIDGPIKARNGNKGLSGKFIRHKSFLFFLSFAIRIGVSGIWQHSKNVAAGGAIQPGELRIMSGKVPRSSWMIVAGADRIINPLLERGSAIVPITMSL
jgi:hypothetical protein